jgi:micrococcal nuclease
MDGDTFEVLKDGEVFRIRMKGIDTPELSGNNNQPEPCAENAKQFLWDTIGNSQVDLEFDSSCGDNPYNTCVDTYDRVLAYVRIHTGEDLATLILKQGLGHVYRFNNESFDRLAAYNSAEETARNDDLGIWDSSGQECR